MELRGHGQPIFTDEGLAGEASAFIPGLGLAHLVLDCEPPEGVEFSPNDDSEDDNPAMDEDEYLP